MTPVPPSSLTVWIRSWAYFVSFLAWTTFCAFALTPFLIRKSWAPHGVRIWTGGIMVLARYVAGITCRVEGLEHVPPGPCIVAAQHQASFETYRLWVDLAHPVFVLKRELVFIPMIGWYMWRSGMVPIDRGARMKAMRQTLRAAQAALDEGRQVVLFPEGTRAPANTVAEFKPGIVALYLHCNAPVIPMALNSGVFWGKTRILKLPGEIVFRFLPAIPPGLDRDAFLAELRARIEGAQATLAR